MGTGTGGSSTSDSDSSSGSGSGRTLARRLGVPVVVLALRLGWGLGLMTACAVGVPSRLTSRTSLCLPAERRSGRQVAAREVLLRRLLAARWTRTVEVESARARPVAFALEERGAAKSSVDLVLGSRAEKVEVRFVRRLLLRKRLELTERMELRFSSTVGCGAGDAGGVDTGVWMLLRRDEGACSSCLKCGDQPSLNAT